MNNSLIDKIKKRGYWRINFRPQVYDQKINSLSGCAEIVKKNMVQLRGWNYPHFPFEQKEYAKLVVGNNYYAGWVDWDYHKEYWRLYQSGQFLHYLALREDWMDESSFDIPPYSNFKPGEAIEVFSTLYQLTEVYEFLARLTRNGIYKEGADVTITLNNTPNRELRLSTPGRMPLYEKYSSSLDSIEFKSQYQNHILLSSTKEQALEALYYFFDRFGWHNPPKLTLQEEQDIFLRS